MGHHASQKKQLKCVRPLSFASGTVHERNLETILSIL